MSSRRIFGRRTPSVHTCARWRKPAALPPPFRPDMRLVKNAFPYAPWMDAVIHFGKNKGKRLGELRMAQAWWYLENYEPREKGDPWEVPDNGDFALRFALNGMLRAIAESPEEQGREAARARSGYPTARDILRKRGLPIPELKPQQTNEQNS